MEQISLGLKLQMETLVLDTNHPNNQFNASIQYQPEFIRARQAIDLHSKLSEIIEWQDESLWIAGKQRKVPRLVAWYGDSEAHYRYSGKLHEPLPWIDELYKIKQKLEAKLDTPFNSVLCNLYRNGQDSMGWHADDEKELGDEPTIASISLGQPRAFHLKHKTNPSLRHKMTLNSGSLLVMRGATQRYWLHQVPKEPKITQPRINLTFRNIIV